MALSGGAADTVAADFSPKTRHGGSVDLGRVAAQYELFGGSIMSALRYASLQELENSGSLATLDAIQRDIPREYAGDGKGGSP